MATHFDHEIKTFEIFLQDNLIPTLVFLLLTKVNSKDFFGHLGLWTQKIFKNSSKKLKISSNRIELYLDGKLLLILL